jgi:hypothetical protein
MQYNGRSHGVGGGGEAELAQAVSLAREHRGFKYLLLHRTYVSGTEEIKSR